MSNEINAEILDRGNWTSPFGLALLFAPTQQVDTMTGTPAAT